MKQFVPYFKQHFYEKLLQPNGNNPIRNRAEGFLRIFEILDSLQKESYSILETGTMRAEHGHLCFGDDGCSTFIFDKFVNIMGGRVISVDISPVNCKYAKANVSEKTEIVFSDSIPFLNSIPENNKFNLVYLDSFDIDRSNPVPSQIHHLEELRACLKNIQKGTILCVDDADAFFDGKTGKATLIKQFMEQIYPDAILLHNGYQIAWKF